MNRNGIQLGVLTILPKEKEPDQVQESIITISFMLREEALHGIR